MNDIYEYLIREKIEEAEEYKELSKQLQEEVNKLKDELLRLREEQEDQ